MGGVNPSEVSEGLEVPPALDVQPEDSQPEPAISAEAPPAAGSLSPSLGNPLWLRLAYALEFFIAVIAIITAWSEIGGEGHLDLMPWYTKLVCILGLAWCSVCFTASLVEQQRVWTGRSVKWFMGILLFCALMGGITYYYHLHEEPDDQDDDNTAAAVNIHYPGTFFDHGYQRTFNCSPSWLVVRSSVPCADRIPAGADGGDSRFCL